MRWTRESWAKRRLRRGRLPLSLSFCLRDVRRHFVRVRPALLAIQRSPCSIHRTFSGFGTPAPTSQPTTSAPLFGAASAPTTSFFGAPKPATPSLFGAPAAPPATPSLFGAPAAPKPVFTGFGAPATSTPAPAGGLFGQAAPAAGGGALFGQQPQQQQQQQPSLFGGLGASGQKPLFGACVHPFRGRSAQRDS
jgi:hypothetical protein